ncbi:hypothetical protein M9Y10_014668 [Tritrichomonas musculus]|uniref:Helicase conserved C-terminal domain containing protein n=1 Tax=Tritrichomonas musculus TaxID=1915356 RepID=A0ABR2L122_9EUKA
MFISNKRQWHSNQKDYLADLQTYNEFLYNFSCNTNNKNQNILILIYTSQITVKSIVSNQLLWENVNQVNQANQEYNYLQSNTLILNNIFDICKLKRMMKYSCKNIKIITFNLDKYFAKTFLFRYQSIYTFLFRSNKNKLNLLPKSFSSNFIKIYEDFQKSLIYKQAINASKVEPLIDNTKLPQSNFNDCISENQQIIQKITKSKPVKHYQFFDDTIMPIHDYFEVILTIKKKFFSCAMYIKNNSILSNKKNFYNMKIASKTILTNFDLYNYLIRNEIRLPKDQIKDLHKLAKTQIHKIIKMSRYNYCETVQNSELKEIIYEINVFVLNHSVYANDLKKNWKKLGKKFSEIEKIHSSNDSVFDLIFNSIENIMKYNQSCKNLSIKEKRSMANNANSVFKAINVVLDFLINEKSKKQSKEVEKMLFKIVFKPNQIESYKTNVFSVINVHDKLINTTNSIFSLSSSTGSGKTRCAPFILAIKTIQDDMKRPFIIMTQPRYSVIKSKINDFKNILGDSIKIVTSINRMLKYYVKLNNNLKLNFNPRFMKPIMGIFTPRSLLELIHKVDQINLNICSVTRFCLDEIHERSVESDVLTAIIARKINDLNKEEKNFPLQLLMMSATPDSRVFKCFRYVSQFKLPDSSLYPVDIIKQQVNDMDKINEAVTDHTIRIIQGMADGSIETGHIIIFTSGNSRMNDIKRMIYEQIKTLSYINNCALKIIQKIDSLYEDDNIDDFYKNLDTLIEEETKKKCFFKMFLFILPIKYIGYASNEQKEICLNPIPNHSNVIKIIMATNAIESSVTIKDLVAVVDSGIHNHSSYNVKNGLSNLIEEPISVQSQIQRKGRVGRIKSGISVQITMKNQKLPEVLPPAIQTSDISLNILSLRKIGYKLEEIDNLPDKINDDEMKKYISELESLKALTLENHELTKFGDLLEKFYLLSPCISAAILSVSGYQHDDEEGILNIVKDEDIKEKDLRILLGCIITLIINSSDLVTNNYSYKLRSYFDKRSDIITLLRTILDLAQFDEKEILINETDFGLESKKVIKMLGKLQSIADNFIFPKEEVQNIIDIKEEKALIWKQIFKSLNKYTEKLVLENNLYQFIQQLIDEIGKNKPEWITSRKVTFANIENSSTVPSFIYKGNEVLSFNTDDSEAFIDLKMRPGSIGLDSPGSGLIFSIIHDNNIKMNHGYLIHSLENDEFIPHPISIETSVILNNDFSAPLLNAYFKDDKDHFQKFSHRSSNNIETGNTLFYRSQEKLTDSEKNQYALFSFVPKDETAIELFTDAVKIIEKLMPFTASTILIPDYDLDCIVSLHCEGNNRIDSSVHFFEKNDYFAYRLNKETIDYLYENIEQLKKCHETLSISITAENMTYSISTNDEFENRNINFERDFYPHTNPLTPYVFNDDPIYHNHLIMASTTKIDTFEESLIPWKININEVFDSEEMSVLHTANNIARNTITFRRSFNRLIFRTHESILQIKGRAPRSYDVADIPLQLGPVSRLYYLCANEYIQGLSLTKPIDFKGFYYRGRPVINIPEISEIPFTFSRYIGNSCYCLDVKDENRINEIIDKVYQLCDDNEVGVCCEDFPVFSAFIRHRVHSNFSQKEFSIKVNSILDAFGGVILKRYDYIEFANKDTYQGMIKILMYWVDFTVPLAAMIQKEIEESEMGPIYNTLSNYIDPVILNDDKVQKVIKKWLNDNDIQIEENFSELTSFSNNIDKVLIEFKKNPPTIPFNAHPIPEQYNIIQINHHIKHFNRTKENKWYLNQLTRTLFTPLEVSDDEIMDFLNHFQESYKKADKCYDDLLYELYSHDEEPTYSRHLISIYNEDGTIEQKHFCVDCLYDTFLYNLRKMYSKEEDCCSLINIYNDILPLTNVSFIQNDDLSAMVPFGQMIWSLIKEPKISNQTKTWITAALIRCLKRSSKITFCPMHPYILIPIKQQGEIIDCPVSSCKYCHCYLCNQWHLKGKCEEEESLPAGSRICPFCKEIVEKSEACNHIHCNCGKDFCYYCGLGFENSSQCYHHMDTEKHWEVAPDYARFILKSIIDDTALKDFYEKYPQWKPKWFENET